MRGERACCQDCGHDTRLMNEIYMVEHSIWQMATDESPAHMLCIGCLEERLGTRLVGEDFIRCPLNDADRYPRSLRLRQRLSAVPSS